jgi:cobalt-zinc-cadmium efflux system outer membrane protein
VKRAGWSAGWIGAALTFVASVASVAIGERPARADYSMDQAVAIALQRNRDVIAARLEIEAAQVDRIAAGLYWNPQLNYGMGNIVLPSGNDQGQGLSPGPFSQLVQTIGVSEVVDVWAKRNARIKVADLGIDQRRLVVEDALREIVYAVRGAFTDVLREQAEHELSAEMKKRYDETVRLSRARANAGEISEAELRKIELEGMKYDNALVDSQLELDLARERLSALLGLASAAQLDGPAVTQEAPRVPPVLGPLATKALQSRPDLLAARKGVVLADAQISAAQHEAYPDIAVGVSYTHSGFTVSGDNPNALGLTLSLPLPAFDRNQAGLARSRLERKRSDNDVVRLELLVGHEVAEAVRRVDRSGILLDTFEGGMLSRAENALKVAESSYKAGAVSLLELLEAQRTYIETRAQYLKAKDDYRKAQVDVTHAVGAREP